MFFFLQIICVPTSKLSQLHIQLIQLFPPTMLLAPVLDDSTVSQLCEMGFPLEACRKAVYYTENTGIDAAMNWIMSHMDETGVQKSGILPERKTSISLTALLTVYVLLCLIGCRFLSPSGVARLQLWPWDHTHRELFRRVPGNYRFYGL